MYKSHQWSIADIVTNVHTSTSTHAHAHAHHTPTTPTQQPHPPTHPPNQANSHTRIQISGSCLHPAYPTCGPCTQVQMTMSSPQNYTNFFNLVVPKEEKRLVCSDYVLAIHLYEYMTLFLCLIFFLMNGEEQSFWVPFKIPPSPFCFKEHILWYC